VFGPHSEVLLKSEVSLTFRKKGQSLPYLDYLPNVKCTLYKRSSLFSLTAIDSKRFSRQVFEAKVKRWMDAAFYKWSGFSQLVEFPPLFFCFFFLQQNLTINVAAGNTKGGSITVLLTSCLTG
jgi:hypothetical protein